MKTETQMLNVTDQTSEQINSLNPNMIVYLTPNYSNDNSGTIVMMKNNRSIAATEDYPALKELLPNFVEYEEFGNFLHSATGPINLVLLNPNEIVSFSKNSLDSISSHTIVMSNDEKLYTNNAPE